MPGPPQRIIKTASVRLSAAGYGYCTITCPGGTMWEIDLTSVSTNVVDPTTSQPRVVVYADSAPNPAKYVEGTYAGNRDSSNTVHRIMGGESLTAEWTAGTAQSLATFRLAGTQREV